MKFLQGDRDLQAICSITFMASMGQGIVSPILPLYVLSFGVSYSMVGLVMSVAGIARLITDIPVGFVLDRIGRKPLLQLATVLLAGSTLIPIFAGDATQLLLFRLVEGTGMGILLITGLTFIGDISPAGKRGSYVSYLLASDFLGFSIGPLLGGGLVEIGGFRTPFVAMMLFSLVGGTLVKGIFKERRVDSSRISGPRAPFLLKAARPDTNLVVGFIAAAVLSVMVAGIGSTAIPLYAESLHFSVFEIGILLTLISLSHVVMLPWSGTTGDKVGTRRVLVCGFAFSAFSSLLLIPAKQFYALAAIAVFLGLSIGLSNSAHTAIAIRSADSALRGTSMGLYRVFRDIGNFAGPFIVGLSSDLAGIWLSFLIAAIACSGVAVIGLTVREAKSMNL